MKLPPTTPQIYFSQVHVPAAFPAPAKRRCKKAHSVPDNPKCVAKRSTLAARSFCKNPGEPLPVPQILFR
ncbi:Chemotaxis response regulator-glutamate methylesterase [Gossypium arboreum]|uniref:Chemotaxis response regulator-glutamate methylesterase n=1 Tax=Gossypium arboreum TaxID=29729 RepID=A0A0B0P0E1_GOSAR|nr:Chemotaxis response regulator-glutamate methylesterase [Gossypium arboreum]